MRARETLLQTFSDVSIHTHTSSRRQMNDAVHTHTHTHAYPWFYVAGESDDADHTHTHIHTHTHTPPCLPLIYAQTHTHIQDAHLLGLPEALPLYTLTSSCLLKSWLMMTHTHTHAHAWFLAQTHISPSCLQERFPCTHVALHASCVLISPACEESS